MHVSAFPELSIKHLLTAPKWPGVFEAFYGREAKGFYHGRGALWRGIKLLGLGGRGNVLLPSYHCGVEVEAVRQAGVGIEFYRIKDDMTVDLRILEEKIKAGCTAVLVIHYYGFPQPIEAIRQLCRRHNVFLIEDCAHALFSSYGGQPLGTYGDIAIFSPTKSLSLPDGGALLVNNPEIEAVVCTERPNRAVVWKRIVGLLIGSQEDKGDARMLRAGVRRIRSLCSICMPSRVSRTYNTGDEFDVSMGHIGMSEISRRIMSGAPIDWVIGKRRLHFQHLLAGIGDSDYWKVCFTSLPEGICPMFFPVRIRRQSRREVQRVLQGFGIDTYVFGERLHPKLPKEEFPEAELLAREVLCLPIHQQLDERKLDSIVRGMNFIRRHTRNVTGMSRSGQNSVPSLGVTGRPGAGVACGEPDWPRPSLQV